MSYLNLKLQKYKLISSILIIWQHNWSVCYVQKKRFLDLRPNYFQLICKKHVYSIFTGFFMIDN